MVSPVVPGQREKGLAPVCCHLERVSQRHCGGEYGYRSLSLGQQEGLPLSDRSGAEVEATLYRLHGETKISGEGLPLNLENQRLAKGIRDDGLV